MKKQLTNLELEMLQVVHGWLKSEPRLQMIWDQKSGWEGWAQVEIALALDKWRIEKGGTYTIEREAHIYDDEDDHVDILFSLSDDSMPTQLIKLKCHDKNSDNGSDDAFATRFGHDIAKIKRQVVAKWDQSTMWAMGITASKAVSQRTAHLLKERIETGRVKYLPVTEDVCLFAWWGTARTQQIEVERDYDVRVDSDGNEEE